MVTKGWYCICERCIYIHSLECGTLMRCPDRNVYDDSVYDDREKAGIDDDFVEPVCPKEE